MKSEIYKPNGGLRVAILEIAPKGHYTYVESLINLFSVDNSNLIDIFTNINGSEQISPFINGKTQLFTKKDTESYTEFFKNITRYDILVAVTIEPNSKEMAKILEAFINTQFDSKLYFVIHNTHYWRQSSIISKLTRLSKFKNIKDLIYRFKIEFIYRNIAPKLIKKVLKSGGKFVGVSENVAQNLSEFIPQNFIIVIPFSLYISKKSQRNSNLKLRVCIPGLIDTKRRNYDAIFNLLKNDENEFFKKNVVFDFLGGIVKTNSIDILIDFKQFEKNGFKILFYEKQYLSQLEYDTELNKADILLFNLNQNPDIGSQYGKTKDSGFIFNMIKAAKPGIIPEWYSFPTQFNDSVITIKNLDQLQAVLENLINNPNEFEALNSNAIKNASLYTPERIYKSLNIT